MLAPGNRALFIPTVEDEDNDDGATCTSRSQHAVMYELSLLTFGSFTISVLHFPRLPSLDIHLRANLAHWLAPIESSNTTKSMPNSTHILNLNVLSTSRAQIRSQYTPE